MPTLFARQNNISYSIINPFWWASGFQRRFVFRPLECHSLHEKNAIFLFKAPRALLAHPLSKVPLSVTAKSLKQPCVRRFVGFVIGGGRVCLLGEHTLAPSPLLILSSVFVMSKLFVLLLCQQGAGDVLVMKEESQRRPRPAPLQHTALFLGRLQAKEM